MQVAEQYDPICVIENKLKLIALGKEEEQEPERTVKFFTLNCSRDINQAHFCLMVFVLTVLSAWNTDPLHINI